MELDHLEATVRRHRIGAIGFVVLVLLAYSGRFLLDKNACVSPAAEPWGQFGDFVGGLLNPVIAFMAFYWLTQSVLIQKSELSDTKKALVESAQSQSRQVMLAERAARISALGSILDSKSAEVAHMRHSLESMAESMNKTGWANTPNGDWIGGAALQDYVKDYRKNLASTQREQVELVTALKEAIHGAA